MKKSKYKQFKQGLYFPKNKSKCLNNEDIVYRSKLERDFMWLCDNNDNIRAWASEKVVVPYYNSGKGRMARYFVDFYIELFDGRRFIIEIKPQKEAEVINDPGLLAKRMAKSKAKKTTLVIEAFNATQNMEKWQAAKKWAEDHSTPTNPMKFLVITEKDLDKIFQR